MNLRLLPLLGLGALTAVALIGGCAKSEPPAPPPPAPSVPKPPLAATDEVWTSEQLAFLQEKFGALETTASGLRYKILQPGTGEARPNRANQVSVYYRGTFLDGRMFDERLKSPFSFRVGVGKVIKGWDEAVMAMQKGEKRLIVVPYWLGYGVAGKIPYIMPRATLVFEIELLGWESTAKIPGGIPPPPGTVERDS
ncbi:MAG: FKBP-type peptidyl-prolyl cis-trans isomerase [Opitutaceae bacterium]|nr:FKBP-type peptidyl-prolyl cis-trans isomerase [Opitutaceae bacterium]